MKNGDDRRMRDDIGQFVYMSLIHSENLSDQELSIRETERVEGPDDLESARRHRDIIARYYSNPY